MKITTKLVPLKVGFKTVLVVFLGKEIGMDDGLRKSTKKHHKYWTG